LPPATIPLGVIFDTLPDPPLLPVKMLPAESAAIQSGWLPAPVEAGQFPPADVPSGDSFMTASEPLSATNMLSVESIAIPRGPLPAPVETGQFPPAGVPFADSFMTVLDPFNVT
jgi:hypothetical protein